MRKAFRPTALPAWLAPIAFAPFVLGVVTTPQAVTIDEGVFRVSIAGRDAGSESFSIRQTGSGATATITATGRISLESGGRTEQITTQLQLSGDYRPAEYQLRIEGAGQERVTGQLRGTRFTAHVVSPSGERMREYIVSDRSVILDTNVAHHYHFVARQVGNAGGIVSLIFPRAGSQAQADVTVTGSASIEVDGTTVDARTLAIRPAGGPDQLLWVDRQNRVLRVEVPTTGYVAQRTTLPR